MIFKICSGTCMKQKQLPLLTLKVNKREKHLNHYEVLKLPSNCTSKEIRDSFIKLSKENHPDKNKSANAHEKFLKINEAYNVLSKPYSRRMYDLGISEPMVHTTARRYTYYEHPNEGSFNQWNDSSFWTNRDKTRDNFYEREPYYGIKGIRKVSNITIVFLCFFFGLAGISLQLLAISNSFTLRRQEMIRKSMMIQSDLNDLRKAAEHNGNDVQIALLEKRLLENEEKINNHKEK